MLAGEDENTATRQMLVFFLLRCNHFPFHDFLACGYPSF